MMSANAWGIAIGIAAAGVGVEQILLSKPTLALLDSQRWLMLLLCIHAI
ncbi:hypothetical protein LC612_15280 [Nostoc sp. CHAB 5834]|nr:hypothetical protein [Nostoc sp. CHAB 5834]